MIKFFGIPTLVQATYNCPCEKHGDSKDTPATIKQPSKGTRISDILWKNVKPAVAKPTECKTFASACEAMAWERSEQADNYINLQGEMPEMLRSKVVDEQYFLMGYTANDMKEQFSGSNFSYDDLKKNFGEICLHFVLGR